MVKEKILKSLLVLNSQENGVSNAISPEVNPSTQSVFNKYLLNVK